MLEDVKFQPKGTIKLVRIFHYIILTVMAISVALMFFEPKDVSYANEIYSTPDDVRASRAYSSTKRAINYITENATSEIKSINSIDWVFKSKDTGGFYKYSDSTYFKISYSTSAGNKTIYLCVSRNVAHNNYPYGQDKITVSEIQKSTYNKNKGSWLIELDQTKAADAREQNYNLYAISIILQDMGW